ncbi:hypothetical protein ACFXEL_30635 [Streptomyces sp. NPDC059382]|uniref:hypothetical protein n=1 Tax=Streptomyces sp. NPDC059382 TaxID=3346816 RepID=UPI00368C4C8C
MTRTPTSRAASYTVIRIGVMQIALLGGSGITRADSEASMEYTSRVPDWPCSRILVGAFGAVLAIVGAVIVVRSLMRKFERNLLTDEMSPRTQRIVAGMGIIGDLACGVFATVAEVSCSSAQYVSAHTRQRRGSVAMPADSIAR